MTAQGYLFAGNAAVWLGIAGYLLFLGIRSSEIGRRLERIERLRDDRG